MEKVPSINNKSELPSNAGFPETYRDRVTERMNKLKLTKLPDDMDWIVLDGVEVQSISKDGVYGGNHRLPKAYDHPEPRLGAMGLFIEDDIPGMGNMISFVGPDGGIRMAPWSRERMEALQGANYTSITWDKDKSMSRGTLHPLSQAKLIEPGAIEKWRELKEQKSEK